jgi:hypothetical protein
MTDIPPPAEVAALQTLDDVARDDIVADLADWGAPGPTADPAPLIDAIGDAIGAVLDENMRLALRMEMLAARDGGSTDDGDLAGRLAWLAIAVSS